MTANIKTHLSELVEFLEKKVPYASALYKKKQGTRISVNRVQESVEQEDPAEGLVFNLWNGQSFFEYSSNDTHWSKIKKELTGILQQAVKSRDKHLPSYEINPGLKLEKSFVSPFKIDPSTIHTFEKLKLTRNLMQTALQSDPSVSNAVSIFNNVTSEDIFVNRNKRLSQKIIRSDVIVVVFVSDGQNMVDLHTGKSKNGGMDSVSISPEEIKRLVEDGKVLVKAKRLSPGLYDTITDSEWSGIIAHECFGHGVETDLYTRGRAKSQSYIGKPVASSIVNMFDDPSQISEAGGFFFDDEGELSSPTQVIQDGILKSGLTDLASSQALKIKRTANGRRESFARKAYARMTNTFFENGTHTKEEMIASIKDGIYLRHATNGMEDPQAWGIQVEGLWGQKIKNGKLTDEVFSPIIMTGFVPDLLKSITMVGNDKDISGLGMCGKGHKEWVKNTTGGPHLKMKARLA